MAGQSGVVGLGYCIGLDSGAYRKARADLADRGV
jgi:hypothetical protein